MEALDRIVKEQETSLNKVVEGLKKSLIQRVDRSLPLEQQKELLDDLARELVEALDSGLNPMIDGYLSDIRLVTKQTTKTRGEIPSSLHPDTQHVFDKIGTKAAKGHNLKGYVKTLTNQMEDAVRLSYDQKLRDRSVDNMTWRHLANPNACDYCKFLDLQGVSFGRQSQNVLIHSQCRCGRFPKKWIKAPLSEKEKTVRDREMEKVRANKRMTQRDREERIKALKESTKTVNAFPNPSERSWEAFERAMMELAEQAIKSDDMDEILEERYTTFFQKQMAATRQVKKFKKENPMLSDDEIVSMTQRWLREKVTSRE